MLAILACPACPVALEARSLVLSETFLINLSYALLPFLVVGVLVREVVKRVDGERTRDGEDP